MDYPQRLSNKNLQTKNKTPKAVDPIYQLAHQCSHSKKYQSTNPQTPLGQYPKCGQLHYPFHPQWTALQDGISDVTREDYDHVTSDNAHLSQEIQELRQQMAHLVSQQQHNKPTPESTTQTPNNNLNQVFIAQVATAMAQIQNESTQPSTKPNKWSATSITESAERGALMDESFDSTAMKS